MHVTKLFSAKYMKYIEHNDEGYEEFVVQYLAAWRDLHFSSSERLQFLHNLFDGEALRFYNANVAGRVRELTEALQLVKEQFKSASKQQQVEAELSKLSFSNFVGKAGGKEEVGVQGAQKSHSETSPIMPCNIGTRKSQDRLSTR